MNDDIKSILQDALEEEIPSDQVELWHAVKQRLVANNHPLFQQGENMKTTQLRFTPRIMLAILTIAALLILAFATPQGRALAQNILQFFTRAETDTLPVQSSYEAVPEAPRILGVAEAEGQSGFDVLVPTFLPGGLNFQGASYTPETNTVVQQFGYIPEEIRLSIKQQPSTVREKCDLCGSVGATAPVETVQIGSVTGEYVEGVWKLTDNGPVWENDPYLKTLRWQKDGMAFELIFMGEELTRTDLISIAESLEP